MRPDAEHKSHAPQSIRCFVLTVSDTRTEENDTSGDAIAKLLRAAGHQVIGRTLVKDDPAAVRETVHAQITGGRVEVVITTGGTGITSRDSTYEVVSSLLEKRQLSHPRAPSAMSRSGLDSHGENWRAHSCGRRSS